MQTKKTFGIALQCILIVAFCILATASKSKKHATTYTSFVEGSPGWAQLKIAKETDYDLAFDDVVSVLSRNFEIEVLSPETGYIRTKWNTTWRRDSEGNYSKDYRVRVTIKMSKKRMRVDINTEAEYRRGNVWIIGNDTQLLETLKSDISGVIGG